jgi:hypothetical protein
MLCLTKVGALNWACRTAANMAQVTAAGSSQSLAHCLNVQLAPGRVKLEVVDACRTTQGSS